MDATRNYHILSEVNQNEKDKYSWFHGVVVSILDWERQILYDIACMWNLKHGTDEPIYKTETDLQT